MRKVKLSMLTLIVLTTVPSIAADPLYEVFKNPPAQARPFVRWWWNGNRVTTEETLRELDVMKEAGIGGFEMNPIAMPAATQDSLDATTPLDWLSGEWNEVVKATAKAARERGMIPDLIVGSGWPFGGRFLESGEQIQIITVNKKKLSGPGTFEGTSKELAEAAIALSGGRRRQRIEVGSEPKLVFLKLVPAETQKLQPGTDMMSKINSDGSIKFDIPPGNHILYAGAWREGYRHVSRGGPGADGPVVDHLNKASVLKYLNKMSDALNPVLDGKMGNHLRAMFCDSLELGHTNWTGDFPEQFRKRRGYDPNPYLHYMADLDPVKGDTEFHDTLKRLRYDFNITVIELFMERFMTTFTEWCHANGVKSRAQAYGRESHPLDTSLLVDIPECEMWIRDVNKSAHPTTINRYVASAAHLMRKTEVSCEAMTNTVTVFRVLPEHIKRADDLNFISGVTHSILHGFNYTPPLAGFPGWVQFGCYFNEKNPWWPYFRKWADYNARISAVLQGSYAQANVAILTPDADIWSTVGRPYHPFAEGEVSSPWYLYRIWEALHQNGYNVEYTSDNVLAQAKFDDGKIRVGPRAYEILILENVETILPKTAKRLAEYAKAGGKIAFVGKAPHRSPSFNNAEQNDQLVKEAINSALAENPDNVAVVPPPTKDNIVAWAGKTMAKFGVQPDVKISSPNQNLSQIHHKIADRDIFFFAWSDMEESIDFQARFNTDVNMIPWQWDPETGSSFLYASDTPNKLQIHLEPLESLLLVFQPDQIGAQFSKPGIDEKQFIKLNPSWQVRFDHAVTNEEFPHPMPKLIDIGKSDDEKLNTFAGTITYKATFDLADTSLRMLDLGKVHGVSEVTLNGKNLGVRWYGRHIYYTRTELKKGTNTLEVKLTTHLGNFVRKAERNTPAGRYAWWYPVEPVGMLGPVRLCKTK